MPTVRIQWDDVPGLKDLDAETVMVEVDPDEQAPVMVRIIPFLGH